ncbi:MobV family relaxase [Acinetobacter baumannii]|uniref:MobV family relaxase n=3 Tax=Acinetobacter calcoaceticus/baumannii complex TaxID=909768 RepID=UPI0030BA6238
MSFAILRTAKLKSFGELGGSLSHNYRTRFTPNADNQRTALNEHDAQTADAAMTSIKNRLPEKLRKNGVLCIEHLITASPEWIGWNDKNAEAEFFTQSRKWLIDRYGSENVITTSIHRDETTPHLIAYVVPMDDTGRLNARKWLGGRKLMSEMQTDFANQVKHLGLERGLEGSRARHTTIKQYYAEIQKPVPTVKDLKVLKIEKKVEMPKIDWMTYLGVSKKEYAEVAQMIAYENTQKKIDVHNAEIEKHFSEIQITFEKKLTAEKMRADKFQKAHERAVYELEALKSKYEHEYAVIKEYKRLFPGEFDATEQLLSHEIETYRLKIDEDKKRIEQEKEQARFKRQYEREKALEESRLAEQNKEKEFKANISLKREMRLDAQHKHFQQRLGGCSSEPEKKAVRRLYEERKASFAADPIDVMNGIFRSSLEKSNHYFRACEELFRIKSQYDFESVLERSIKYFEQNAPLYQSGMGVIDGPVTRKVCAATSTWLDKLLDRYGSKYEDQAETLRHHLLACEEKAEQSIFKYVLDDAIYEEQKKTYIAENSISQDFTIRQQAKEREKGFDLDL